MAGAAALVHAMLQATSGVLVLLSGHSIGARHGHHVVLRLQASYVLGVSAIIGGMIAALAFVLSILPAPRWMLWLGIALVAVVTGLICTLRYYRRRSGTALWIPRDLADYLRTRAARTRSPAEALALGVTSALADLPFAIAPLAVVAMLLTGPSVSYAVVGLLAVAYMLIVALPLWIIVALIGGGRRVSAVQRWRETNKRFLQYGAGMGSLLIAFGIVSLYLMGSD
jgi:hypothetical protein